MINEEMVKKNRLNKNRGKSGNGVDQRSGWKENMRVCGVDEDIVIKNTEGK